MPSTENNEDKPNDSRLSIFRAFEVCGDNKRKVEDSSNENNTSVSWT